MASSWASARTLLARSLKRSNVPINRVSKGISVQASSGSDYTFASLGCPRFVHDICWGLTYRARQTPPFGVDSHHTDTHNFPRTYYLGQGCQMTGRDVAVVDQTLDAARDPCPT